MAAAAARAHRIPWSIFDAMRVKIRDEGVVRSHKAASIWRSAWTARGGRTSFGALDRARPKAPRLLAPRDDLVASLKQPRRGRSPDRARRRAHRLSTRRSPSVFPQTQRADHVRGPPRDRGQLLELPVSYKARAAPWRRATESDLSQPTSEDAALAALAAFGRRLPGARGISRRIRTMWRRPLARGARSFAVTRPRSETPLYHERVSKACTSSATENHQDPTVHFPTDEAATKLSICLRNILTNWKSTSIEWSHAMHHLAAALLASAFTERNPRCSWPHRKTDRPLPPLLRVPLTALPACRASPSLLTARPPHLVRYELAASAPSSACTVIGLET